MDTFSKLFNKFLFFFNIFIYSFLLYVLIYSLWDKSIMNRMDFDWITKFLILEIWFNIILRQRSTEIFNN